MHSPRFYSERQLHYRSGMRVFQSPFTSLRQHGERAQAIIGIQSPVVGLAERAPPVEVVPSSSSPSAYQGPVRLSRPVSITPSSQRITTRVGLSLASAISAAGPDRANKRLWLVSALGSSVRASVRHTDAFSSAVQLDTTVHQWIAAKGALGFVLGNSLDQEMIYSHSSHPEKNSANCSDRMDGAASQAQGIGAK